MNRAVASVVLFTNLAFVCATAAQTTDPGPPTVDRPVSWKLLLPNVISDQKRIWTFPGAPVRGKNWIPTAAVLGAPAGLVGFDPAEAAWFRRTSTFHGFNNVFTGNATALGTIAAPVSLYAIGR